MQNWHLFLIDFALLENPSILEFVFAGYDYSLRLFLSVV